MRAGNLLMIQTIAKVEQDLNQAARYEPLSIFPDFSVSISVCLFVCLSHLSVSVSLFLSFSISLRVSLCRPKTILPDHCSSWLPNGAALQSLPLPAPVIPPTSRGLCLSWVHPSSWPLHLMIPPNWQALDGEEAHRPVWAETQQFVDLIRQMWKRCCHGGKVSIPGGQAIIKCPNPHTSNYCTRAGVPAS